MLLKLGGEMGGKKRDITYFPPFFLRVRGGPGNEAEHLGYYSLEVSCIGLEFSMYKLGYYWMPLATWLHIRLFMIHAT